MKKNYLFAIVINLMFFGYGQSNCDMVYSSLEYANSHITKAYEAKLYDDLKFSAKNAKSSLEKARGLLLNCNSKDTKANVNEAISLLQETAKASSFGEAQFNVYKATELVKNSINALNIYTSNDGDSDDLLTLQQQQLDLEQQRLALKQKEEEINSKIAQKAKKELEIKKLNIIVKNNKLIEDNLETYSKTLNTYNCNNSVNTPKNNITTVKLKPLEEIKTHYFNIIIGLSEEFSDKLKKCKQSLN